MAFVNLLVINLFAFVLLDVTILQLAILLVDVFYVAFKVTLIRNGKYTPFVPTLPKILSRVVLVIYICLLFAGVYTQFLSTDALVVNAKLQNCIDSDSPYKTFIPVIPKELGNHVLFSHEISEEITELRNRIKNTKDNAEKDKLYEDITKLKYSSANIADDFLKSVKIVEYYFGFLMLLAVLYRSLDNEAFFNKRKKNKEVKDIGTY